MNIQDKQAIWELRQNGYSFTQIAAKLNLSRNTVKSYCHRESIPKSFVQNKSGICKQCGKRLENSRKNKRFCSDRCRWDWWNQHRKDQSRSEVL